MKDSAQEARILALAAKQGITLDPCLLKDYPLGTVFWAVHHSVMVEPLTEPLANRIEYILTEKDAHERAIRLTALRPMKVVPKKWAKASAEWAKADAEWAKADGLKQWDAEYPEHPAWNAKTGLVFPETKETP